MKPQEILILHGGPTESMAADSLQVAETVCRIYTAQTHACALIHIENPFEVVNLLFNQDKHKLVFNASVFEQAATGEMASAIETLEFTILGEEARAQAVCRNKIYTKELVCEDKYVTWAAKHALDYNSIRSMYNQKYPANEIVIKPINGGGSQGVVKTHCDIHPNYFQKLLYEGRHQMYAEEFIEGDDITYATIGSTIVGTMLMPMGAAIYSEGMKNGEEPVERILPAPLPLKWKQQLQAFIKHSKTVLGLRGMCRFDFRYDTKNDHMYFLEINTAVALLPNRAYLRCATASNNRFEDILKILMENVLHEIGDF